MKLLLPIETKSESNIHEHWRAKAMRVRNQKLAVTLSLKAVQRSGAAFLPARVTFTRIGVRLLDDDNLAGGFKQIRDSVAEWCGCGDSPKDPIQWVYQQITAKEAKEQYPQYKGGYAIIIQVERVAPIEESKG